jgi:hypothetical protein
MYAPPPAYGAPYGAPPPAFGYAQPPPPPAFYPQQQQQGPMIINLGQNNSSGSPCGICGKDTDSIPRKKLGCVAWAWCICLLFTVGAYGLCLIPLCSDSCKDTQLVCIKCQNIKQTIPANCCWSSSLIITINL